MSSTAQGPGSVIPQGAAESTPAERCFGVFTEPVKTFASIARKPDFWTPLIVMMIVSVATTEILLNRVGMAQIIRRSLEVSGRASTMTSEQIQQAVTQGAKFGAVITQIIGFVSVPIIVLILAAVGMFIMKLMFDKPVGFKTAYSATAYANLPMFLAGILAIIVIILGDPGSINPRNMTPTNIGFFLSPDSVSRPLMSIATSIDFFSFWLMGLLGIAFASTAGGKTKPRTVFFCFLGLWVIYVLIKTGLAAI
ncbi:MAG: YIP1 family protein [Terriglobia bacterium]